MELCDGGELFDRIVARGRYSERAAAGVAKTIAEVVRMCHQHDVMHKDLKPENFLFANKKENSALKVIDLGFSVFFKPGVALAILRGVIDFKREPWPQVSESAKSLVRQMLEPDPPKRLTVQQVLVQPDEKMVYSPFLESVNRLLVLWLNFGIVETQWLLKSTMLLYWLLAAMVMEL